MTDAKAVAKALLKDLREFTCEDVPEQFSDDSEMYEEGDETAPFFTEAYLYNLLGKSDARRLLGRWKQTESTITAALAQREREVVEMCLREVQALCNDEVTCYVQDKGGCDHPNVESVHNGNAARVADNFRIWCRRQGGGG